MKKRIIDLLNDVLNNKVPKMIEEDGLEWLYFEEKKDYLLQHSEDPEDIYFFQDKVASGLTFGIDFFSEEVEIIEEDKTIEKLMQLDTRETRNCIIKIQDKINEVIDAVNKLKVDDKH